MDCSGFQAELPDLIYGELDPEVRPAVEAHLSSCSECAGLTDELRQVKGSLPRVDLPPRLGARIQVAARDVLLEERPPAPLRGGPLHLTAAAVLGLTLVIVGFGLGVAWERTDEEASSSGLLLPAPDRPPSTPDPGPGDPPERPDPGQATAPRAPEAWQKVLFDAARSHLDNGDATRAREFYRRAEAVNPQGPLAIPSRLGAAEAALLLGRREDARALLRSVRASLAAGEVARPEPVLERVQALEQELGD